MFESITKRFSRKPEDVYCQHCGQDLTAAGGNVATNGKIYCFGYKEGSKMSCLEKDLIISTDTKRITSDFYDPKMVQQAIKAKELTQFGPLEEKVDGKE
ncbi:hypothetical protein ACFLZB_00490 [Nanoarchaeota archaeon]